MLKSAAVRHRNPGWDYLAEMEAVDLEKEAAGGRSDHPEPAADRSDALVAASLNLREDVPVRDRLISF